MMDRSRIEQQLADTPWCDVELRGVEWIDEGRGVVLTLRLPPSESEKQRDRVLRARWVTELTTTLSFAKRTCGHPLTWDVEFERDSTGEWLVRFDFGSVGELGFRCGDIELLSAPEERPKEPSPD